MTDNNYYYKYLKYKIKYLKMKKLIGSAKRKRESIFDETFSSWTEEDDTNISLDDLPEDLELTGKNIEQWIINKSFNKESVDRLVKLSYTAPHDIENEIDEFKIQTKDGKQINRNISIKTTTTNSINCADAVIFLSEYIKLILIEKKKFDMIIIKINKSNIKDVKYLRINLNEAHNNNLFSGVSPEYLNEYLNELIEIKTKIREMNKNSEYSLNEEEIRNLVNDVKKRYNFLYFTLSFKKPNYCKNRLARLQIIFKLATFLKSVDEDKRNEVIRDSGRYFTIVTNFKKPKVNECRKTGIKPETLKF